MSRIKGLGYFVREKTPIRKKNWASFKDLIPGRELVSQDARFVGKFVCEAV